MSNNVVPAAEEIYQGFRLSVYATETPCGTSRGRLTISPLTGENDLAIKDSLVEYPTALKATSAHLRIECPGTVHLGRFAAG